MNRGESKSCLNNLKDHLPHLKPSTKGAMGLLFIASLFFLSACISASTTPALTRDQVAHKTAVAAGPYAKMFGSTHSPEGIPPVITTALSGIVRYLQITNPKNNHKNVCSATIVGQNEKKIAVQVNPHCWSEGILDNLEYRIGMAGNPNFSAVKKNGPIQFSTKDTLNSNGPFVDMAVIAFDKPINYTPAPSIKYTSKPLLKDDEIYCGGNVSTNDNGFGLPVVLMVGKATVDSGPTALHYKLGLYSNRASQNLYLAKDDPIRPVIAPHGSSSGGCLILAGSEPELVGFLAATDPRYQPDNPILFAIVGINPPPAQGLNLKSLVEASLK